MILMQIQSSEVVLLALGFMLIIVAVHMVRAGWGKGGWFKKFLEKGDRHEDWQTYWE